jgi:outer membrane protein assembly factor BamB
VLSADGQELARIRVRDDVASEARSDGRDVYFGQAGIYRLDEMTGGGVSGGARYFAPDVARRRQLPGAPEFLHDTTLAPAPLDSAVHRIALGFWPESNSQGVGLANDALYLSFYRMLFSLTADARGVHWVRATPSDIVGSAGHSAGVVVVEESGTVSAFDHTGGVVLEARLGFSPLLASVRAEGLATSGVEEALPSLVAQLSAAALHDDTRLVPAGELAVRLLAQLPDDDASASLIEICSKGELTRRIRDAACELLGGRKEGVDSVLVALAKHSDYLRDERAPPLSPLSKAAATAGDRRAAPLLLAHLEDPATDADDLPVLMASLITLGDASVVPAVARFLKLYHADVANGSLADALVLATQLLAKLAPDSAAATLEAVASDAMGDPAVREAARKELAKLPRSEAPAGSGDQPTAKPAEGAAEAATVAGPKGRLTADDLASALTPVRSEITGCVRNDPNHTASARLTIVVDPDGSLVSVHTLPNSLLACVEPLVRRIKLPATSFGKRETLHHTITR